LSGPSDEWFPLPILIRAGCFADEHDFGVRIANAKDGLSARAGQVPAFCAITNPFTNRCEDLRFVGRDKLQLREHDTRWSEAVLREYGNLSSSSLFFVLDAAFNDSPMPGYWWMSSFGAGFSCHGALLQVE